MRVWKYELHTGRQTIQMPAGAQIVSAQMQGSSPCIWALVDPDRMLKPRIVELVGTGEPMDRSGRRHVGTMVTGRGGKLVLHVFEVVRL